MRLVNRGQTNDKEYFTNGKLNNKTLLGCIANDESSKFDGEHQWDGFEGYKYLREFMAKYAYGMEDRDIVTKIEENVFLQLRTDKTPFEDDDGTKTKAYRILHNPSS